jgi:hypothetical protein
LDNHPVLYGLHHTALCWQGKQVLEKARSQWRFLAYICYPCSKVMNECIAISTITASLSQNLTILCQSQVYVVPSTQETKKTRNKQKKKVSITISQSVGYSRIVMEEGGWVLHKRKPQSGVSSFHRLTLSYSNNLAFAGLLHLVFPVGHIRNSS